MNNIKICIYIICGFLIGVTWACGSSSTINQAIADAIGSAVDIVYDNSNGLSSTNVQSAIEEVNTTVTTLSNQQKIDDELEADLIGAWSGTHCDGDTCNNISLNLSINNDFTCNDGNSNAFRSACDDSTATWEILKRVLKITFINQDDDNDVTYYFIVYSDSSNLLMSDGVNILYQLTKGE